MGFKKNETIFNFDVKLFLPIFLQTLRHGHKIVGEAFGKI